ncbi:phosphotransferase [Paraliobacillus salinarum]|uniref:phosphotransferase n=1 Tax=Paraliobacillus salinarum TaxID=1158996 RepID=UPI0015F4B28B|nr:phosphotransferase [Paraliobacillus salinarum]
MSNNGKDDSILNRLVVFLKDEACLSIQSINLIKPTIYFIIDQHNQQFILKGYRKNETIDKQLELFNQLDASFVIPFCAFPNKKQYLLWEGYYWTLQKYCSGRKLNFNNKKDRDDAWKTMKQFHNQTNELNLTRKSRSTDFISKWQGRLDKWKQSKELINYLGFPILYDEIEEQLLHSIDAFLSINQPAIEENPLYQTNWIHGDVASHNFLRDNKGNVYLIDFDLLSASPSIYDEIQLGQRYLPYIGHDFNQLADYIEPGSTQAYQLFRVALTIPADFVREWWYFVVKTNELTKISHFLIDFQLSWEERKQFVRKINKT